MSFFDYLYRLFIVLTIFLVLMTCSCCFYNEREANYVNANRYIPMLKTYIKSDGAVHDNLKDIYYLSLDTWYELIKSKYNGGK